MGKHDNQKGLAHDFSTLYGRLKKVASKVRLQTPPPHSKNFDAVADTATKGRHQGEKVIRITKNGEQRALIYQCCWGYTTSDYGTWIGGYSEALDKWAEQK